MIKGVNPTEKEFEIIEQFGSELSDLENIGSVIDNLEERRKNLMKGGVNCIPLPFERFRSEIPGIEQGQYVVITANQKTGKCFAKGTRIRMADNTIKNIEDELNLIEELNKILIKEEKKKKKVLKKK